jgi:AraC-like DNA-binding protein
MLFRGALVSVRDVACQPETVACGCAECAAAHQLIFPRHGVFVVHHGDERSVMDSNQVFLLNAWQPHRVSHLDLEGDACTVLEFDESVLDEAARDGTPADVTRPARPFPRWQALIDAESALASRSLFAQLSRHRADALETEENGLRLLRRALRSAYGGGAGRDSARRRARAGQRRISRTVQECLAARPFERWSLAALARAAGASPYHLARSFRATVGMPIHQYQLRLRLAAGLDRVLAGCDDLTDLALDLGFSSHSHFTAAFRSTFGLPPAALRADTTRPERARLRKISTAAAAPIG